MLKFFDFKTSAKFFGVIAAAQIVGTLLFSAIIGLPVLVVSVLNFFGTLFALDKLGPKIGVVAELVEPKEPL